MSANMTPNHNELSAIDYIEHRARLNGRPRFANVYLEFLDEVPDWDRVRRESDRISRVVARMRQRLVPPAVPMTQAHWVTDPDFNLDYHLRRLALPGPGTQRQLLDLVQTLQAGPLDLDRPRWEMTLVEGLNEGGAAAIVWKVGRPLDASFLTYRATQNGVVEVGERSALPPIPVPEDVTALELARRDLRRLPRAAGHEIPRRLDGTVRQLVSHVRDPLTTARDARRLVGSVWRLTSGATAPPSPLFRRRGTSRRIETMEVGLVDLARAGVGSDCSGADAFLAAVLIGLHHYHVQLGVPVPTVPVALPGSHPGADTAPRPDGLGSTWAGFLVAAPIDTADAATTLQWVRDSLRDARGEPALGLVRAVTPLLSWAPVQALAAAADTTRAIDVHVDLLPGHTSRLRFADVSASRLVPIHALVDGALSIALYPLADRGHVGVTMDPAAVTDPDALMKALAQGVDDVIALAAPRDPR